MYAQQNSSSPQLFPGQEKLWMELTLLARNTSVVQTTNILHPGEIILIVKAKE